MTVTLDSKVATIQTKTVTVAIKSGTARYDVEYIILPDHADSTEGMFIGWQLVDDGVVYPKGTPVYITEDMAFTAVYKSMEENQIPWSAHLADGRFDIFPYDADQDTLTAEYTSGDSTDADAYADEIVYSINLPYRDIIIADMTEGSIDLSTLVDSSWTVNTDKTIATRKFYSYTGDITLTVPATLYIEDADTGKELEATVSDGNKTVTLVTAATDATMSAYSVKTFNIRKNTYYVTVTTNEEA